MELDRLLQETIEQARAIGIPAAEGICPRVGLNTRATGRFGCCVRRGEDYYIEVSARLLPAGERAVRETLAHEVLHTCPGCRNHGARWKDHAARMNAAYGYRISRTGTWEALGLEDPRKINHVLFCERCGREFKRARASSLVRRPERYRCACGGKLIKRF